jgi:hypothetical protein
MFDFSIQEVKECAISCMGLVISTFGDKLQGELSMCLPLLVDRMGNEITRLTAVKVVLIESLVKYFILTGGNFVSESFSLVCWICLLMIRLFTTFSIVSSRNGIHLTLYFNPMVISLCF